MRSKTDGWVTEMFLWYVRETGKLLFSARRLRYEAKYEKEGEEMARFYSNLADKDEVLAVKAFGRSLFYRDMLEEQGVFLG